MDRLVIGVWQGVCKDGDLAANISRTREVIDQAARAALNAAGSKRPEGNDR